MLLILTVQNEHPSLGAAYTYTGHAETPQLFWEHPAMTASKVTAWPKYASRPQRRCSSSPCLQEAWAKTLNGARPEGLAVRKDRETTHVVRCETEIFRIKS
jgi:hypothetical protein